MLLILLFVSFIAEGIGFTLLKGFVFPYFFLPGLLFFYYFFRKKTFFLPPRLSLSYGLFFIFSLVSTFFFSVDKEVSFGLNILYLTGFLLFLFFYNNKNALGRGFIKQVIIYGSIIFTSVFLLNFYLKKVPLNQFQLVFPYYGTLHNHLGDFLGLALVFFVFYFLNKKPNKYVYLLIFFPFILISFSRSALVALLATTAVIFIKNKLSIRLFSRKALLIAVIAVLAVVFFFGTVKEAKNQPIIGKVYNLLETTFDVSSKDFGAGRLEYLKQAYLGFLERPFFGVGAGNFGFVSKKYSAYSSAGTSAAHNIILETLIDNGIFSAGFFLVFILLLVVSIFRKNRLENYLMLYLLLNFQTDYTYRISTFLILFMILAGLVYEEKKPVNFNFGFGFLSIIIIIVCELILAGWIFFKTGLTEKAFYTYPLNKSVYPNFINSKKNKGCLFSLKYANFYYYLSPGDIPTLEFLSKFYENCGNKKMALKTIETAVENNKFISLPITKRFYFLKKEIEGKEKADRSFLTIFERFKSVFWQSQVFENKVREFCREENIVGCRFRYFWQPEANSLEHPNPQLPFSKVKNRLNADGLNDRFNYSVKKPKDTFRIMVLGGSEAYGQYVETKNNWTELLEDDLNKNLNCPRYKKVEVINLGMHGYDIAYSIERFNLKGKKYNPDLIIFLTPSLYISNEEIQLRSDPSQNWQRAFDKTMSEVGEEKIFKKQKVLLQELKENYTAHIIFFRNDSFDKIEKYFITDIFKNKSKINILEAGLKNNTEAFFPDGWSFNKTGHKIVEKTAFNFLKSPICLK